MNKRNFFKTLAAGIAGSFIPFSKYTSKRIKFHVREEHGIVLCNPNALVKIHLD